MRGAGTGGAGAVASTSSIQQGAMSAPGSMHDGDLEGQVMTGPAASHLLWSSVCMCTYVSLGGVHCGSE